MYIKKIISVQKMGVTISFSMIILKHWEASFIFKTMNVYL
jgi:hypothetical protein